MFCYRKVQLALNQHGAAAAVKHFSKLWPVWCALISITYIRVARMLSIIFSTYTNFCCSLWRRKLDYVKILQVKYFTGKSIPIYGIYHVVCVRVVPVHIVAYNECVNTLTGLLASSLRLVNSVQLRHVTSKNLTVFSQDCEFIVQVLENATLSSLYSYERSIQALPP